MNETEIAQQVAQNIPSEPETPPALPVVEAPKLSAFETSIELNDPAISLQIADYLGVSRVDRFSEERQTQMREVYRWCAEQIGSTEFDKVLTQLQLLEMELGSTYKTDRLTILSRWVKMHRQSEALRVGMEYLKNG